MGLPSSTKEATNFASISRLLVDGGTLTLRKVFDSIHPPGTLPAALLSHRPLMLRLKRRKILTDLQWELLFPASSGCVDSSMFDITLLVVLLRNICSLPAPVKGWDELPAVTDTSMQDDIARIKFYRNVVYAHALKASLSDVDFTDIWAKVRDALLRLGANTTDIDELKNGFMDPEANLRCIKALEQWCLHEHNIEEIKKLNRGVRRVAHGVTEVDVKMVEIDRKMEEVRKELKEMKGQLEVAPRMQPAATETSLKDHNYQLPPVTFTVHDNSGPLWPSSHFRMPWPPASFCWTEQGVSLENLSTAGGFHTKGAQFSAQPCARLPLYSVAGCPFTSRTTFSDSASDPSWLASLGGYDGEIRGMFECVPALVLSDPPLRGKIADAYERRFTWLHPYPWLEHVQLALKDVFTKIRILVREKGRYWISDETVHMSDIFKPHEHCQHPRRVLVEADPGMGKTIFSEKLCLDWSTGNIGENFPHFPLVVLVKCRDMTTDNIMDAITDQLLPRDASEEEKSSLSNYIKENQSRVLLIVDGIDELQGVDLSDLVKGRVLSDVYLLVTTRHTAGIHLRQHFDSLFEITGYTVSDAKEYIRKYFICIGEAEKGERLIHSINQMTDENGEARSQEDVYLTELLCNPLRTSLLCVVFEDCGDKLPASRTLLYTEINSLILSHFYKKEHPGDKLPDDLLLYFKEELLILGNLALQGVVKEQLYFDASELENCSPIIPKLGFLSEEAASSKRKPLLNLSFTHKTFQEYFAALHLCEEFCSREDVGKKFIKEHASDGLKFTQVWIFAAGILAERGPTAALFSFLETLARSLTASYVETAKRGSNHWLHQTGNIRLIFLLLCDCVCEGVVGGELNEEQKELCAVIGREISWKELWLIRCVEVETSDRVKVLCEVLKNNKSVKWLGLANSYLSDVTLLVESIWQNTTLKLLNLRHNPIRDKRALKALKQRNAELRIITDK